MTRPQEFRIAVVTGASSGVGLAIAEHLVRHDWRVIGLARDRTKLEKAQRQLGELFDFFVVDIARADQVNATFSGIRDLYPSVDLLVNNAGLFRSRPFRDCTASDIDALIDTNLKGTLYVVLEALPLLRRPGGYIVNIGSVAGTRGISNQAIYCASKHGMNGFADAIGQELGLEGIRVTTICPGGIATTLWNSTNPYHGEFADLLHPDDIAQLVGHLVSAPNRVVYKSVVMFPSNEWH